VLRTDEQKDLDMGPDVEKSERNGGELKDPPCSQGRGGKRVGMKKKDGRRAFGPSLGAEDLKAPLDKLYIGFRITFEPRKRPRVRSE